MIRLVIIHIKSTFRITLISFLILFSCVSFAQDPVKNMPTYDRAPWHPGFTLGFNTSDFVINFTQGFSLSDSLQQITSSSASGFDLGIVTDFRLGDNFDLRFVPGLAFAGRTLYYTFTHNNNRNVTYVLSKTVESTYADLPIDLKFKSVRINNYRLYVLGGWKYAIDFLSQANAIFTPNQANIKLTRYDFGYELGVGIDLYLEFFKLSIELKAYHGINDIVVKDNTPYSRYIAGLFTKMFYFDFNFE
jgi:hypothetical protein